MVFPAGRTELKVLAHPALKQVSSYRIQHGWRPSHGCLFHSYGVWPVLQVGQGEDQECDSPAVASPRVPGSPQGVFLWKRIQRQVGLKATSPTVMIL